MNVEYPTHYHLPHGESLSVYPDGRMLQHGRPVELVFKFDKLEKVSGVTDDGQAEQYANSLQEQINELAYEMGRFANRVDNEFGEMRKWMAAI